MRQIVLDTETTGLEPEQGHRIIEIGCVELVNRRRTGREYHQYLNPERAIDAGATDVHGITAEDLANKPRFADIAEEFLRFISGAELVIHNAAFDVAFLNHELARLDSHHGRIQDICKVLDTLELARQMHPGQKNSLDALCKRYNIDNSQRTVHGALLDAQILADVYLAMTGGQAALSLDGVARAGAGSADGIRPVVRQGLVLRVVTASEAEVAAHRERLEAIRRAAGGRCLWDAWLAAESGNPPS